MIMYLREAYAMFIPDILDNEVISYKEWSQNDHQHLSLYTKEYQVGELKEKWLKGFNIHQTHVQVKRVVRATFERDKLDSNSIVIAS